MWVLLGNPTSGGGRGELVLTKTKNFLHAKQIQFLDITCGTAEMSQMKLDSLVLDKYKGLILVGGDGLVNLAIQRLAHSNLPIVILPAGTGNDIARSLNLNLEDPIANLEFALQNRPKAIDLGVIGQRYFAEILSTGFDSLVNERANRLRLIKGRMKYNIAILLVLSTFKPKRYFFKVDEVEFESRAMLIAVSNGRSYGGGMQITPMAELDDGYFDLMILGPVSRWEFLKVFPRVFTGSHVNHPAVKFIKGRHVAIAADAIAYADGELIGPLPIEAQVSRNALRVWRK